VERLLQLSENLASNQTNLPSFLLKNLLFMLAEQIARKVTHLLHKTHSIEDNLFVIITVK
jgi:hypothetical protein